MFCFFQAKFLFWEPREEWLFVGRTLITIELPVRFGLFLSCDSDLAKEKWLEESKETA